jgi:hypothetical protein
MYITDAYAILFIFIPTNIMIKVIKNESIAAYYIIYDNGVPVDEIQGRLKAKRYAMKLAMKLKQSFFAFLDEIVDVE